MTEQNVPYVYTFSIKNLKVSPRVSHHICLSEVCDILIIVIVVVKMTDIMDNYEQICHYLKIIQLSTNKLEIVKTTIEDVFM